MNLRSLPLVLLVVPLFAHDAAAQTLVPPGPRQGYFVALAGGGGVVINRDEELGALPTWPGGGGSLRLGQALAPGWSLGLFLDFTAAGGPRRDGIGSGLGLEVGRQLGEAWLVSAGVGLGFARLDDRRDAEADALGGFGTRVRLTAQRDFFPWTRPLGGGLALAPLVSVELLPADGFAALTASVGLQVTYWSGLPRDRLVLPLEQAYDPID